jgi:3-phosphoshikimate 1-carboxyvinyltransferase
LTTLVVHPAARPLTGSVPVPGDTEIALGAVVFAALAQGTTHLAGLPRDAALASLARCLRALGASIDETSPSSWDIEGPCPSGLSAPLADLDCGDSLSSAIVLCALLAGQHFRSTVTGTGSLLGADLTSFVAPLRLRGGTVLSSGGPRDTATRVPLSIGPLAEGRTLSPLEHASDVAAAHVKTALLLSGLYAEGPTIIREPSVSADHTERMLAALGAPVRTIGPIIRLDPAQSSGPWPAFRMTVPGDPSAAAYLVAAAQVVAGSRVTVRGVSTNPTRSGFLELARALGAGLEVESHGEELGEPVADLHAWCAEPRPAALGGEPLERAGDALPAACAVAAVATGTTQVRASDNAAETLAATATALRAFGVECSAGSDGMAIRGRGPRVAPADVDTGGDARVAMAACVLALAASGPSRVRDAGPIAARFPKFVATLRALGATIEVEAR